MKIMHQFVAQFMIILQRLKLKKDLHILAVQAKKKKNSDIILCILMCAFSLFPHIYIIFSLFLRFNTLELESSLAPFFALWFMCSKKKKKQQKKKKKKKTRNEHCVDASREKTTFSVRHCHKKRILMLLYAEKMREKKLPRTKMRKSFDDQENIVRYC